MNRKIWGVLLALALVFGVSLMVGPAPATTTGPTADYVKVTEPADGAVIGIGKQIVVETKAPITADTVIVQLVKTPGDTTDVTPTAAPDSVKSSDSKTIWTWYYTVRPGDPTATVKARSKLVYDAGADTSSAWVLSDESFTFDGQRPVSSAYIDTVIIDKTYADTLAIGDTLTVTLRIKAAAVDPIRNGELTKALVYLSPPSATADTSESKGFEIDLGNEYNAAGEIVKKYCVAEGDFGDLEKVQAFGYLVDKAGNLSSTADNSPKPVGVASADSTTIDAKRPFLGVPGFVDTTSPDSTLYPGSGDMFTDIEKPFRYSVSETVDSVKVTFGGKYTYVATNVSPPSGSGIKVTGDKFKDADGKKMPDGTYDYTIWAKDKAGNTNSVTVTGVTYDKTDLVFKYLFPTATYVDTINASTRAVSFMLSEVADTVCIKYTGIEGADKDSTRSYVLKADELTNLGLQSFDIALVDSTKYYLVLYGKDPAGNVTVDSAGAMWYVEAFTAPVLTSFKVEVDSSYSSGPDATPGKADTVLAGEKIDLRITAWDTLNNKRASAFAEEVLIKAVGGTGITWSGDGVTDNKDGTATLDAYHWSGGTRVVTVADSIADGELTVEVLHPTTDAEHTGSIELAWLANIYDRYAVIAPATVTTSQTFQVIVGPTDKYGNLSLRKAVGAGADTIHTARVTFSANKAMTLPTGEQVFTGAAFAATPAAYDTFDVVAPAEATTGLVISVRDKRNITGSSAPITVQVPPVVITVTPDTTVVTAGVPLSVTVTVSGGGTPVKLWATNSKVWVPEFVDAVDGVATFDVVASGPCTFKIGAKVGDEISYSPEITVEAAAVDAPDTLIVTDVPGDNGGWVQVKFPVSTTNLEGGGYILYREVPVAGDTTGATTWEIWATCPDVAEDSVVVTLSTAPYYTLVTNWGVRAVKAPYFSSLTQGLTPKLSVADGQVSAMTYGTGGAVDNIAPAAPAELRAVDNPGDTGGAVLLTWALSPDDKLVDSRADISGRQNQIYGVTGYQIYRNGELIATVGRGINSYVDATVDNNVEYTYVVKATDGTFAVASEANLAIAVDNTLLADWNSDLKVWTEDFAMFVRNFGLGKADAEYDPVFDLNGDGKVWTEDFTIFVGQFGQTAGAAKAIASAEGVNTGASAAVDISREGAAITVDVSAQGLRELTSYGLKVSFDPEALQFVGADRGNLLSGNSLFAAIPTGAGEVWVLNGQPEAVSTNSGLLSQLHFRALNDQAVGSAIRVDALDLFDSDARLNSLAAQGLEVTVAPEKFALLQNYPNPGNPSTTIRYSLAKDSKVNLTIYNCLGQAVRTLVDGYQAANIYKVVWDGRDNSGKEVASGIYFYRLVAGDFTATKRLVILK